MSPQKICAENKMSLKVGHWMDGWMDGWMGGWVGGWN